MRIMVTGSRDWPHSYSYVVERTLSEYADQNPSIVVGDCPTGIDLYTKQFASLKNWPIEIFEADWLRHGRAAGPIRNMLMARSLPDLCIAFLKDKSSGTLNAITCARSQDVKCRVIHYKDVTKDL